jgi:uncharacterized protein
MVRPQITPDTLRAQLEQYLAPTLREYRSRLPHHTQSKIIRDVIWDFNELLPYELALVDSPPFQRLRNIFQTSLALFTYPCSVHSRFEHSLGAAAVASRMIGAIRRRTRRHNPVFEIETRLAALLHNIGHGPFSHSSEKFYKGLRAPDGSGIFDSLERQEPKFANASASEVITFLLITTGSFQELWSQIVDMYVTMSQILGR